MTGAAAREILLRHHRRPHAMGGLSGAIAPVAVRDPLGTGHVRLQVWLADDRVAEARFEAVGVALVTISASLMAEAIAGRTVEEALALRAAVGRLLAGGAAPGDAERLGDVAALGAAVEEEPALERVILLPWQALDLALAGRMAPAPVR